MAEWYLQASPEEVLTRTKPICYDYDYWNKQALKDFNYNLNAVEAENPAHAYALLKAILQNHNPFVKALYYQQYAFSKNLADPDIAPFMHITTLFKILQQNHCALVKRLLEMYQAQGTDITGIVHRLYVQALQEKRLDIMHNLSDDFEIDYVQVFLNLYTDNHVNLKLLLGDALNHNCNVLNCILQMNLNQLRLNLTQNLKQLLWQYYWTLDYNLLQKVAAQKSDGFGNFVQQQLI